MSNEKPRLSHWTVLACETALSERIEVAKEMQLACQSVENRAEWREIEDICRDALREIQTLKSLFPIRPNRFIRITGKLEEAK